MVGWTFDEETVAEHRTAGKGHIFALNPVEASGARRYSLSSKMLDAHRKVRNLLRLRPGPGHRGQGRAGDALGDGGHQCGREVHDPAQPPGRDGVAVVQPGTGYVSRFTSARGLDTMGG